MKVLAIDTTGLAASVAIVDYKKTVAEFTVNFKKTHSQTIMPMLDYMFDIIGIEPKEVDYIACANGPGSFTGLRIGAASAKGIAHALSKKIIPIPTLDALAYNIFKTDKIIVPMIDARNNQVYTSFYRHDNDKFEKITDYFAENITIVLETLKNKFSEKVIFLGDGAKVYFDKIKYFYGEDVFVSPNSNMQRAASVGALAIKMGEEYAVNYDEFSIIYLRKPQAEREYDEREKLK